MVLDTNVLISALLIASSNSADIYADWIDGSFTLLTSEEQLVELRRTLAKPAIATRVRPHNAGRLVNGLKKFAVVLGPLPRVRRSTDADDDFLLAMAECGKADYLVTGDKAGLLSPGSLRRGKNRFDTRICRPFEVGSDPFERSVPFRPNATSHT